MSYEKEIINLLNNIQILLLVLVIVIIIHIVINFIRKYRNYNYKNYIENKFINEADDLFDSKEYNQLLSHCNFKLTKFPNHSNAIWWKAKAQLALENINEAELLFKKLLKIEPSWNDELIKPYLKQIQKNKEAD